MFNSLVLATSLFISMFLAPLMPINAELPSAPALASAPSLPLSPVSHDEVHPLPSPESNDEQVDPELFDLEISLTNDEEETSDAWASLDAVVQSGALGDALSDMRVSFIGTSPNAIDTPTLFSVPNSYDSNSVFVKSLNLSGDLPLSDMSADDVDLMLANIPTCDVAPDLTCLTVDSAGNEVAVKL